MMVQEMYEISDEAVSSDTTATGKSSTRPKKTSQKATSKITEKKTTCSTKTTSTRKVKREVYIQYSGRQIDEETLYQRVLEDCKSHDIKSTELKLYLKPEENACYYIANSDYAGKVILY